jgi:circadian clock protein KaiB
MTQKRRRSAQMGLDSGRTEGPAEHYVLRLYVAGATERSLRAIANVKAICEQYLEGRYDLKVVDIYRQPTLLRKDQIVAVPTLVKKLPVPLRLMVGDLSRTDQVLQGLGLVAHA